MDNLFKTLMEEYKKHFTDNFSALRYFFAPGRVTLIGEHTDYNGGYVFPCALDIGTYAIANSRKDQRFRMFSINFPESGIIEFSLTDLAYKKSHDWANYPKGVIHTVLESGYKLTHGLDIMFLGNLPNGAGLSSSASIEVLTGTILNYYFDLKLTPTEIALLGQKAENNYIGVGCGIMDQFASAMGKKDHAILLDCNSLDYKYAKLNLGKYKLVIANTNKKRGLADSKYNERLNECQKALILLQQTLAIKALGQINIPTLEAHAKLINDPLIYKRAYHAVSENQRAQEATEALNKEDLIKFGLLMTQSHISLRDNYEVIGKELDSLVSAAWEHPACLGARMTGAGFGGCTVSLVSESMVDDFIEKVGHKYFQLTQLKADFYIVNPSEGAREIKI